MFLIKNYSKQTEKISLRNDLKNTPSSFENKSEKIQEQSANLAQKTDTPRENERTLSAFPDQDKSQSGKKQASEKSKNQNSPPSDIKITTKKITWGFEEKKERAIEAIIIHSSYDALGADPYDLEGLLEEYRLYEVAPHYVIDRKGNLFNLISDQNIAYHAGKSHLPDGRTNVNQISIGIELINKEDDFYTDAQYASLNNLLKILKKRYTVKYVLGHNDIASERKTDPWNFDWKKIDF